VKFQDAKDTFPILSHPPRVLPTNLERDKLKTQKIHEEKSFTGTFQVHPKNCY